MIRWLILSGNVVNDDLFGATNGRTTELYPWNANKSGVFQILDHAHKKTHFKTSASSNGGSFFPLRAIQHLGAVVADVANFWFTGPILIASAS